VQAWGSFWNPSLYNNKHLHHLSGNLTTLGLAMQKLLRLANARYG
jgi:hypothetical protein